MNPVHFWDFQVGCLIWSLHQFKYGAALTIHSVHWNRWNFLGPKDDLSAVCKCRHLRIDFEIDLDGITNNNWNLLLFFSMSVVFLSSSPSMWRCEGYSITHHFKKLASKLLGTCDFVSAKLPGLSKQKWIWWSSVPIFKQRNCSRKTHIWKTHCPKKTGSNILQFRNVDGKTMKNYGWSMLKLPSFYFAERWLSGSGVTIAIPRLAQKAVQEQLNIPQSKTPRSSNQRINPSWFDCTAAEGRETPPH